MTNEIMTAKHVVLSLPEGGWQNAVEVLARIMLEEKQITSFPEFMRKVIERENITSTYCGQGIAIPHAVSRAVTRPALCVGRSKGFAWHEGDEWVRLVFLLAIPETENDNEYASMHIDVLTCIAELALDEENIERWLAASSEDEIVKSIISAVLAKNVTL